mmetsp:Transcript_35654/g.113285  ORF Transcript_35654/g.113285 Transcript_35654/m.113285 type:complete len:208 (+) Transcript_35654:458-1081(+)
MLVLRPGIRRPASGLRLGLHLARPLCRNPACRRRMILAGAPAAGEPVVPASGVRRSNPAGQEAREVVHVVELALAVAQHCLVADVIDLRAQRLGTRASAGRSRSWRAGSYGPAVVNAAATSCVGPCSGVHPRAVALHALPISARPRRLLGLGSSDWRSITGALSPGRLQVLEKPQHGCKSRDSRAAGRLWQPGGKPYKCCELGFEKP